MITFYPDKNSLKQVFDSELSLSKLKRLCKEKGIFLLSSNKNDIVNTSHLFYWGFSDINQISEMMEDEKNYKKSFRLELKTATNEVVDEGNNTGDNVFNNFVSQISAYRNSVATANGISFDALSIDGQNNDRKLKAIVSYKKKRRGRVKLLDETTQHFSFEASKTEDDKMIVDIIFDDRGDISIAKKIIKDAVAISNCFDIPIQISLNSLTTEERVDLFDRFLAYTFANWRVTSVHSIKVQKENQVETDEEEVEEVENNFLEGIDSALFSGSGLRTNPIIVDAVNKGYFFPKAIIMFEHRRQATKLLLDVSFNTDDLLLEVSVVATYDIEDGRDYKNPLSVEEQKEALSYFHGIINQIYNEIKLERIED